MGRKIFKQLRLMVTALSSGIILAGTVALWSTIPASYKTMFLAALAIGLYSCLRLALAPTEGNNTYDEKNNSNAHPDEATV